jgi:hypothetical protein
MYRILLKKIRSRDEKFGIVNFNYDLLLDFAFKDVFGPTFQDINDYLRINYIKPHGSVNWFLDRRPKDRELNFDRKFDFDTRVRIDTAIENMYKDIPLIFSGHKMIEPNDRNLYRIDNVLREFNNQYFYPLIFLPITQKAYSSITGFEKKIIKKARQIFSKASEIYFIGYRAEDQIILDLFKYVPASCTELHVVNTKKSAKPVADAIKKKFPNKKARVQLWEEGFKNFVSKY